MSIPSIIVGEGNWAGKSGNLLGYAVSDVKIVPREFTVSRALNTATRVNASGNIEGVNANIPRIDYFGGQASLLVEPSGQNWIPQGDNMSSFGTFTLGGAIAPSKSATLSLSGQSNAVSLIGGNGSVGSFGIFQFIATGLTSGQTVTYSVFAKAGTNNFISIQHANAAGTGGGVAFFDLSNGTTPTANARIENYGNGWYRCIMPPFTFTSNPVGSYNIGHYVTPNATTLSWSTSYLNRSVTFYGGQLEIGSVATSYIPTLSTAPVTRNADVVSVTGVAGLIGQTEGTVYLEMQADAAGTGTAIFIVGNASSNYIYIGKDSNKMRLRIRIGSTDVFDNQDTILNGSPLKIAVAYQQGGNCAAYVNGNFLVSGTAGNFTAALTGIGLTDKANLPFDTISAIIRIRAASIYQTRLPNTTTDGSPSLQSITTL